MKVLIVRFSSIGDIVLTSPVISALADANEGIQIHYLIKEQFKSIVEPNPLVQKVFTIQKSINEVLKELKAEKYDYIIDLHHNIRTQSLKIKLKVPTLAFDKLNIKKWQLVKFKKDYLPDMNVVERYLETVKTLNLNEEKHYPVQYFIEKENKVDVVNEYNIEPAKYIAVAIGAQFATKKMPVELLIEIIEQLEEKVVLIGGPTDEKEASLIEEHFSDGRIVNTVGQLNLQQSSSVVQQAKKLLTNDTGMMHIATAFDLPIVSVWGNTVPKFGMYPYRESKRSYSIHEVKGLSCRPCSKIGFDKCPKKHFKCMKDQDVESIVKDLN